MTFFILFFFIQVLNERLAAFLDGGKHTGLRGRPTTSTVV